MKDIEKLIIGMLILILLGGIFGYTVITNRLDRLVVEQDDLNERVYRISDEVTSSIESFKEELLNKVASFSYVYTDYDSEKQMIEINVKVGLKESNPSAKYMATIIEEEQSEGIQLVLNNEEALSYMASVQLDFNKNYTVTIMEESVDGGLSLLNSKALYIRLNDQFSQNRVFDMGSAGSASTKERIEYRTFIVNSYSIEDLEVDKVMINVKYLGEVIDSYDVTGELLSSKTVEDLEAQVDGASDKELEPEERPFFWGLTSEEIEKKMTGEYVEQGILESDLTYYMHGFKLDYKNDYPELGLGKDEAFEIELEYEVWFFDGGSLVLGD